jgi:2-methylcitrate dehydratase
LKYLLAAALIDGQVSPEQLQTERICRPDVQELLTRIDVRPDEALTARYPHATPVRIHLVLRDGRRLSREQDDFEGAAGRPLTWDRTMEKFHWLAEQYADDTLRNAIIDTVEHLESVPISELTESLTNVSVQLRFPKTRQPLTVARTARPSRP